MTQEKIRRDTRSNFGARGWGIILYAFINYYLYDSIANSALNAVVPGIAADRGFNVAALTALSTPAGLIALFVSIWIGRVAAKHGTKKVQIITLISGGVFVIAWGRRAIICSTRCCWSSLSA